MDFEGNATYLDLDFDKKVYVGDVDESGKWYGKVGSDMVIVDIDSKQIIENLSGQGMPGWDMAYNINGLFYAAHNNQLYSFDPISKTKTSLGNMNGDEIPNSGHGAQWTGKDGYHYISNNKTGKIFRINVETKESRLCMISEANLRFNDGFACPTELPVVFQYDYGDLSIFPIARQLVYDQDLGNDQKPDFPMVWLGERITDELFDPSNSTASGDDYDDGFSMITTQVYPDSTFRANISISSNVADKKAFWGMWIDWDSDGYYDDFQNGQVDVTSSEDQEVNFQVPSSFDKETLSVRVRVTSKLIEESDFSGDILEPGEVEDYVLSANQTELCGNGLDDNNDGLLDCDDPVCFKYCEYEKSGSSQEGGLESNGDLINKITQSKFQRKSRQSRQYLDKRNLKKMSKSVSNEMSLRGLIPVDIIEGTETYINSPTHLLDITNATDLFAVDVFEEDKRVAAILALESANGPYEHTKHICDRLTGSKLLNLLKYKIDGHNEMIISKLELPNGNIEYACSFGIRGYNDGNIVVESNWNIAEYTQNESFLNFQVWSNNTNYLFKLVNEILLKTKSSGNIMNIVSKELPDVYVKAGKVIGDTLYLDIVNKINASAFKGSGVIAYTETQSPQALNFETQLTGKENETVKIHTGSAYYVSLSLSNDETSGSDNVFVANGAWSYFIDGNNSVNQYNVSPSKEYQTDEYKIERDLKATGSVENNITFYRSFNPRFEGINLDEYNSLSFKGKGNVELEIALMQEDISDWTSQSKTKVKLTSSMQDYVLGKSFFKDGNDQIRDWDQTYMLVINVLNNRPNATEFDIELTDFSLGNHKDESAYLVYSDKNIINGIGESHVANEVDGTEMGEIFRSAETPDSSFTFYIQNLKNEILEVEDLEIMEISGALWSQYFEPFSLDPGETKSIQLKYDPSLNPSDMQARVNVFVYTGASSDIVSFNLTASMSCIARDDIKTKHLADTPPSKEFKAKKEIQSDAAIQSDKEVIFNSGDIITLQPGFEINEGAEVLFTITDDCKTEK